MNALLGLAFLVGIAALLVEIFRATIVGKLGEAFVSRALSELEPAKYTILDDLLLPSSGSIATTQLDHVVVSDFGIFVIETKSFKGWIFGNANAQYWTQVLYRHREKFYNPLRQNYAHVKAIEALIRTSFPAVPVLGFVAFPSAGKLKVSGTDAVGHARDVVLKIREHTTPALAEDEKKRVIQMILGANITGKDARKRHIADAQSVRRLRR